jgi:hypothetical protein
MREGVGRHRRSLEAYTTNKPSIKLDIQSTFQVCESRY